MLILNPELVRFGAAVWARAAAVVIEQEAVRVVAEQDHLGPHEAFVDAARVRTLVTVTHEPDAGAAVTETVGALGMLVVEAAAAGSDAHRTRVTVSAVITAVRYRWASPGKYQRVVTLQAQASTGAANPLVTEAMTNRAEPVV